jgi:hypothetical protein
MSKKRYVLWAFLAFLIVVIFATLERLYAIASGSMNPGLATIGVSIIIISLFSLCLASMGITGLVVAAVRRGWISPRPGSLLEKVVRLWRQIAPTYYYSPVLDVEPEELVGPVTDEDVKESVMDEFSVAELDDLLSYISSGKGRGRKSQKSDEDRFRAVRDWTIMQRKGTSEKLQDFLDNRFGCYDSGFPRVPAATFYGWRRKIRQDLRTYKESKNNISSDRK